MAIHDEQLDLQQMRRAIELAARGRGRVEPNPMVGCVIARGDRIVGQGWHERFGDPHAEIVALRAAGEAPLEGATMYVSLEPCCHHGKTPPCSEAVVRSGIRRVVLAQADPFPRVDGGGIRKLEEAGIEVEVGLCNDEARWLNAPYLKLVGTGRPWIIAKWAMTLDGKIATHGGDSQWISNETSRRVVHDMRGRVDAVLVGIGTVRADDPSLTARPPGARVAARVVADSRASTPVDSRLARTAREVPVLLAVGPQAPREKCDALAGAGCEIIPCDAATPNARIEQLFDELGRRRMTNVLVEGGGQLLGGLLDLGAVDEVHAFIAPKLIGGRAAPGPVAGRGVELMAQALLLEDPQLEDLDGDVHVYGRTGLSLPA